MKNFFVCWRSFLTNILARLILKKTTQKRKESLNANQDNDSGKEVYVDYEEVKKNKNWNIVRNGIIELANTVWEWEKIYCMRNIGVISCTIITNSMQWSNSIQILLVTWL